MVIHLCRNLRIVSGNGVQRFTDTCMVYPRPFSSSHTPTAFCHSPTSTVDCSSFKISTSTSRYKSYIIAAIVCLIATFVFIIPILVAIPLFIKAWSMKKAWKLLTINGTMIHPALLSTRPNIKSMEESVRPLFCT